MALRSLKGIVKADQDGEEVTIYGSDKDVLGEVMAFLQKTGVDFSNLTTAEPNLEDVFLKLTGRKIRG